MMWPPASWPAWPGASFVNPKGRLVLACTNSAPNTCASPQTVVAYSYDQMGHISDFWQCAPYNSAGAVWHSTYAYDLGGNVTQWTHPKGFNVTNTFNSTAQLTSVQTNSSGTNVPIANLTWTAFGAVNTFSSPCVPTGCATTPQETYDYNNRLHPVRVRLGTSANAAADYCLMYNYYPGATLPTTCAVPTPGSSGNNGNVAGDAYLDSVNTSLGRTATYGYDNLNRVSTATAKNLSGTTLWSQAYGYDRWGNMSCSGSGACTPMTYNTSTNRVASAGSPASYPTFDAAGDLTSDSGSNTGYNYTWDAEGRLVTSTPPGGTATTYDYNALGERVQLVAPTYTYNYPFDAFGQEIGIHNSSTGWGHYTVEMAGRRIFLSGSATRWLFHPNVVGSSTMVSDQTGAVVQDATYYPWGQLWQSPGSFGGNWNFAAFGVIEPTTNLYPTPTRRYAVSYSRWLTPDPGGEKVVTLADPQTWNMYSYVRDTPLTRNDPSGLCDADNEHHGWLWCAAHAVGWVQTQKEFEASVQPERTWLINNVARNSAEAKALRDRKSTRLNSSHRT